jgi:hypothetical protein
MDLPSNAGIVLRRPDAARRASIGLDPRSTSLARQPSLALDGT